MGRLRLLYGVSTSLTSSIFTIAWFNSLLYFYQIVYPAILIISTIGVAIMWPKHRSFMVHVWQYESSYCKVAKLCSPVSVSIYVNLSVGIFMIVYTDKYCVEYE